MCIKAEAGGLKVIHRIPKVKYGMQSSFQMGYILCSFWINRYISLTMEVLYIPVRQLQCQ